MGLHQNLEAIKQKGIEEGIEKGIEKGIEEGMARGREEGIVLVARRLIDMGLDNTAIATATGIPEEKIEWLRGQIHGESRAKTVRIAPPGGFSIQR